MRALISNKLYEWSLTPYQAFKKNEAWPIGIAGLLQYPKTSLSQQLSSFLLHHNFNLQEKLESDYVFHVLTAAGTSVTEEISIQYYLFDNGPRSVCLPSVIFIGTILCTDHLNLFLSKYSEGKSGRTFYQFDFYTPINQPITPIKDTFLIQQTL